MAKKKNDQQQELFPGLCEVIKVNPMKMETHRLFHNNEWYFPLFDMILGMAEEENPEEYWEELVSQNESLESIATPLEIEDDNGDTFEDLYATVEGLFTLAQLIPSEKSLSIKKWLAKVGYERIKEEHNPDILIKRAIATYSAKGYDEEWISARIDSTKGRKALTDEWNSRGVKDPRDYAALSTILSRGTFNITEKQHKSLKGLKSQTLRDHMSNYELALITFAEATTKELARNRDTQGVRPNKVAARDAGEIAGNARRDFEKVIGEPVVTSSNHLKSAPKAKQIPFSAGKKKKK